MARNKPAESEERDELPAAETPDIAAPEPIVWRFVGGYLADGRPARFVRGVPGRDLTQDEIERLSAEQRAQALASGLYDPVEKASN